MDNSTVEKFGLRVSDDDTPTIVIWRAAEALDFIAKHEIDPTGKDMDEISSLCSIVSSYLFAEGDKFAAEEENM